MEIKRQVTTFSYKVEPKPDGGFIARSTDPSIPALEAPTREELQKQIQEKLASALSSSLGGLSFPFGLGKTFNLQIKPEGNLSLHPGSEQTDSATISPEQAKHAAEEIANILGNNFPALKAALEYKIQSSNAKLSTGPGNGQQVNVTIKKTSFDDGWFGGADKTQKGPKILEGDARFSSDPITPESSGMAGFWKLLFAVLILAGIAYVFLHR